MEMPPIFYEVHSGLPREGPGSNESTQRAFKTLKNLPTKPRILDIGCGPGMQTIELAKLSSGQIEAVDNHQPFLDQLNSSAKKEGLSDKIKTVKGDMFYLKYEKDSFDIVWCEGAIFIIGFEKGLCEWRPLLKNGGYMVVSELSFFREDLPQELAVYMKEMYAGLEGSEARSVEANLETAKEISFKVVDSFALPKSGWWDNYYLPIEAKLPQLKAKHKDEPEAMQYLAGEEREIEMYRKYSDYYGYAFYVLQKL
ncbi:MAG: class I SAM-dependent methyltransferase [Candidatus Bathyarchaeia archaeon]|jgi:ubiquinone/menaquinone biosynthesis C-methylase UbiE